MEVLEILKNPQVIGIGAVTIVALYIVWQITKKAIDVVERNARAMENLSKNVQENTEATKSMKQNVDSFTQVLISSLKK